MTANVDLTFHPDTRAEHAYVAFVLQLPLVVASDPGPVDLGSKLRLRDGTFMICVDDDKLTRMMCKFLALECGAMEFKVLGETFAEVEMMVASVKNIAMRYGETNTVLLLDQNMDSYKEGKVFGTDITSELRSDGYKGIILIRSANDDAASANQYRRAGANGCVGKTLELTEL